LGRFGSIVSGDRFASNGARNGGGNRAVTISPIGRYGFRMERGNNR
jgi:hypothetical protein